MTFLPVFFSILFLLATKKENCLFWGEKLSLQQLKMQRPLTAGNLPEQTMRDGIVDPEMAQDAFIDLDDPNNEIVDEDNMAEIEEDDDNVAYNVPAHGSRKRMAETDLNNGEEDNYDDDGVGNGAGTDGEEDDADVEDLNEVPDCEPERDDALCFFTARDASPVHAVAVHPADSGLFVAGGQSDEVYVLKLDEESRSVHNLAVLREAHADTISILAFSPDGTTLASGGLDGVVAIWCTVTWKLRHALRDLSGELLTLLWHPSGLVLVAGADDGQAAMWNVSKGTLAMYFAGHGGGITCTAWTPCRKRLVAGASDGAVVVFAPRTGQQEFHIAKGLSADRASVTTLCCLGDSSGEAPLGDYDDRCVVGCADGTLHVISLNSGRVVTSLPEVHTQAIESLHVNVGSRGSHTTPPQLLLSASCDCRVAVWSAADLKLRTVFQVGESVIPAAWASGYFVVAGCSDGEIKVWDGRSQQQEPLVRLMGHRRMVLSFAIVESSGVVASTSDDGTVRFFKLSL
ncbi:hypothetical protein, conserved [Trypanosoma brucei brucei TREU927]|uniref:Uncharacterized protein n=2 Tax=Trypanozoon TaxID=39700 RepID=Q57Z39_TRYB2|nr:hypothetical protein, conserved [Trypanosoma brucei brucei TREU927]AAX80611.1 hypothetical protein, conserved [Trypanosoma brucei]AAZ11521.1 hypothetical protein, conserved [Trypanosoma brucei brucei TREU927]